MDAAADAAEDPATASSEIQVKSEHLEEHSSMGDDYQSLDSSAPPPPPPPASESESAIGNPKLRNRLHKLETAIVEGKRRRKSRLSQETLQEALAGSDDDIMDEDEVVEDSKVQFVKSLQERRKDKDFVPRDHNKRGESRPPIHEEEILGKCLHCDEFLKKGQALTHMADKHPDDIVNRMQCPICSQTPNYSSLENHLQVWRGLSADGGSIFNSPFIHTCKLNHELIIY